MRVARFFTDWCMHHLLWAARLHTKHRMRACMCAQSEMIAAGHSSRLVFHTFSNTGELDEGSPALGRVHVCLQSATLDES